MKSTRVLAFVVVTVSFLALAGVELILGPNLDREYWHLFEVVTLLASIFFYLPGAVAAILFSIAAGVYFLPENLGSLIGYATLASVGLIVGWYAQQQKKEQDHLGKLVLVDRLTQLHNYSYFIDRLEEERGRADRFGSRLSLMMIDIDFFKPINDEYGHSIGNEFLRQLAAVLESRVRAVDIVTRYGGEEFAILLPNTNTTAALEVAERIRFGVEAHSFSLADAKISLRKTISAGVATYPNDADDDISLIDKADEALYIAKQTGRNKAVAYRDKKDVQPALTEVK